MKIVKRLSAILLSVSLGIVFVYSGYTKIFPVEPFEFTFVDIGIANWYVAPVMARLLIGLEFFIGLLLLMGYNLRRFTIPFTIGLLAFFIIYLVIQIIKNGDTGNCGCFGETIHMSPSEGILKNVIMIIVAILIYVLWEGWHLRYNSLFLSLAALTVSGVPFVLNPVDYTYTSNNLDEKVGYPLELHLLYTPEDSSKVEIPTVELRRDKHVVAFLSLTCGHCRIAAKKFRLIKKNNPDLPIYFVLNGNKTDFPEFMEDTRANNIPYSYCLGKTFVQLSSAHLPRIYYLDNGIVVKKVDYYELNQYAIENWINSGKP